MNYGYDDAVWAGVDAMPPPPQLLKPEETGLPPDSDEAREAAEQVNIARLAEYEQHMSARLARQRRDEYITLRAREEAREQRDREKAAKAKAEAALQYRVKDGATFLLDAPATPPVVWGSGDDILWAAGEALIIAGPQGVGKTTLAAQVLRGVLGLSGEVLGYPIKATNKRALYLAMDRPAQAARNLRRLFHPEEREILAEVLRVWTGPPAADFAVAPQTLTEMCHQHEADVVFVDSLKDAAVGLSKDEVGAGYNRARQMALAEGIEVVELHHVVKNGADGHKPNNINGIYGSTWITSGAGSVILLWGEPGDPLVEFSHLKQPINVVGPFNIEHDAETGVSSIVVDEQKDLVEMARRCATTGLSASDAAAVMFETEQPDKGQVAKGRRKLQALAKKGLLVVREPEGTGRGHEARWYPAARSADVEQARERYR